MAFFDSLLSAIPGGSLISAGSSLIGGLAGAFGGDDASEQLAADNEKARAELRAAKERGIGHIDYATGKATDILNPMTAERPIMLSTHRGLTDQQQIGRKDLIRTGQAQLAASGLRGAGRAGVASLMDAIGRYDAGARSGNNAADLTALQTARGSSDAAKNRLVDVDVNSGNAKANTELGVGSALAGNYQNQGTATAQIGQNVAGTIGGAITKAGQSLGNGLDFGNSYASGNSPNLGGTNSMIPKSVDFTDRTATV